MSVTGSCEVRSGTGALPPAPTADELRDERDQKMQAHQNLGERERERERVRETKPEEEECLSEVCLELRKCQ